MAPLDNTVGAVFVGATVAAVLYGFTCVQTWYYFTNYPSDLWYIKLLVVAVFISDTCHQALISHEVYTYAITHFGDFEEVHKLVWSLVVEVFFNGFTTLLVQCFLTMRIYKLSNKNWLITSLAMIFVIAEFLSAIIFGIEALPLRTYTEFATLNDLSMTINGLAAAGDVLIAIFLCYMLHKSRTGFQKSDSVIGTLIVFSINTGLLTSLCAIASLLSISVWPHAWIYLGFYYCIGRLYCNSLLATLNARKRLRGEPRDVDMSLTLQGNSMQQKLNQASMLGTASSRMPNNISIKVDTTHEYIRDEQHSFASADAKDLDIV